MQYLKRLAGLTLMVIALPLMIPGLLVVGLCFLLPLGIVFFLLNLIGEFFLTLKMGWRKQFVPWYLLRELQAGDKLVVEYPTLGWRISRLWLVPSRLFHQCPYTPPTTEEERRAFDDRNDAFAVHPFDQWIYEEVTSPVRGGGILIRAWNGSWLRKHFERTHPGIEVIEVPTASAAMKQERLSDEPKSDRNSET